jgi:homocysteine S-methyltransferase
VPGALSDAIAEGPVVLDGGLATELERRGNDLSGALWSARILRDAPVEIVETHRGFYAAGAQVATSASYQVGFERLGGAAAPLLRESVALARAAGDGWVAASVGPYGAARADGSEYTGAYGVGPDRLAVAALRNWHRRRLDVLVEAGPDVLAVETIPCLAEVEALVAEIDRISFPAWVSVTTERGRLRSGESLETALEIAGGSPWVLAVGVNCVAPGEVDGALDAVRRASRPAVVYPNSGEGWDAVARGWDGSAAFDPAAAPGWVRAGARLVGGCCRVTPADIAAVVENLNRT